MEPPKALRALRMARWCLDSATDSSSLDSINVSKVSSSGAGFFAWMYDWMAPEAFWHRWENSRMSSLSRISAGGVDWTN